MLRDGYIDVAQIRTTHVLNIKCHSKYPFPSNDYRIRIHNAIIKAEKDAANKALSEGIESMPGSVVDELIDEY
jgi:hypothetical protein